MGKKNVIVSIFLAGAILVGGFSTKVWVQSSDIKNSITPEVPEEETSYYLKNREQLFSKREEENKYKIRSNILTVQKYEHQEKYLQALKDEIEAKIKAENGKLELGYTTESSVEELKLQLQETKLQIETVQEQQKQYKEIIKIYDGEYVPIAISEDISALTDDYVTKFLQDNLQIKYYENQIKTYQEYLDENEKAKNFKEIQIQRDLVELDKKQYEADLRVYVKEKMLQYETIFRNITQVNDEIALIEEKIQADKILFDNGKITKIQIIELETEREKLIYEKMCLIYDADCIRYVLEYKIEGV